MRALKAATIIMGVLILVGTAVLIGVIVKRSTSPAPLPGEGTAGLVPSSSAPYATNLPVPPGSHVTGIAATGGLLAVSIGGGADEVVLIDPHSGQAVGTVKLTSH